jgi:hypothetical protein
MKFLCSNCKAKYQIADEKVAGRTLRMTCRRCQEEIVIRGEPVPITASFVPSMVPGGSRVPPSPPPAAAPSPLGADFQMQVASNIRSALTPVPTPDEWHVAINDVPVGPIRREDIARKLAAGQIDSESLAWREGMDDWVPICQIPELARLSVPPPGGGVHAPPPLHALPPMRNDAMSFAGKRPSAPPYGIEPGWAEDRSSQVAMNPSLVDQVSLRRSTPSWPAMFAVACGFAFLMSGMAIFGARWLREPSEEKQQTAAVAGAAGTVAVQPTPPVLELPEDEEEGVDLEIDLDESTPASAARKGTGQRAPAGAAKQKKALTAAEKELLARMGGSSGSDLAGLKPDQEGATGTRKATGSLSSEAVSKVVLRGRKNLQRCYETAARGSGSDETVRMDVEMTVAPSGNVASVKTSGGNLPGMAQCIQRTVKMWRFPQSGESSPVKFPLLFQPGA